MKVSVFAFVFVLLCFYTATAQAQDYYYYFGGGFGEPITIGKPYTYYVYITEPPVLFVTLTAYTQQSIQISTNVFKFSAEVMNISFTIQEVNPSPGSTTDVITWDSGPSSENFTAPGHTTFQLVQRTIDLDRGFTKNFPATSTIGIPTSSFAIGLEAYPSGSSTVTVTPVSVGGGVSFTPEQFTFTSTPTDIVFNYVVSQTGANVVYWVLSGSVASWYAPPPNATIQSGLRTVSFSPFQSQVPININSDQYRFSMDYIVSSLTISPSAPNTHFNPNTITIGTSTPTAQMSFISSKVNSISIQLKLSGPYSDWFYDIPNQYVAITQKTFTVSYDENQSFGTIIAGVYSPVYTITADYLPAGEVDVSFIGSDGSGLVFVPSTVTFSSTVVTNTFRIYSPLAIGGTVSFVLGTGGDNANFAPPAAGSINVKALEIQDPGFESTMNCGDVGNYVMALSSPPPTGVTVNIYANGIVFNPSEFDFTPTLTVIPFTVSAVFPGTATVKYSLSGDDSGLFSALPDATVTVAQKVINLPTYDQIYAGVITPFVISLNYAPSSDLTITPYGSGLYFSPTSFVFNANSPLDVSFTITPTVPGSVTVSYQVTGTDVGAYNELTPTVVVVAPVNLVTPTTMADVPVFAWSQPYTIYTEQVLLNPITIGFFGLDLNFNPPTLTLTPGQPSGIFQVQGVKTGAKTVFFTNVTGPGYLYLAPTGSCGVSITLRDFTMPASLPDVYSQIASNEITIGLKDLPFNGITIQPVAPDTVFSPAVLSFGPNTRTQTFTYTSNTGSATGIARGVTWLVAGPDAAYYATPASLGFNVLLRPLYMSSPIQPTYGIPFVFTITTPIVPSNGLTITPVGAHTFSPASATLGPDSTGEGPASVSFTATPTMLGPSPIKVLVSGQDAVLYDKLGDIQLTTQQATFVVHLPSNISLTIGESSGPILVSTTISTAHDVSLTINSPQVEVNPSVLTFGPTTTTAYFTVTANPSVWSIAESGTVSFTYTIGGTDAAFFAMGPNSAPATVIQPYKSFKVSTSSLNLMLGTPSTFTVTLNDNPPNFFILTPTVETNSGITITPASATFSQGNYFATFSVQTDFAFSPATAIDLTVTGPDAFLYKDQAAGSAIGITFQSGTITTNFPSSVKAGQVTVVEFMDVSGIIPQSPVVVTPYVITGPNITITPEELVFDPITLSARYTIIADEPGTAVVAYNITGDNVSWFQMDSQTYTLTIEPLNFVGFSQTTLTTDKLVVGVPTRTFTINVDYLPPTGVTLTPYSPDLTFIPSTFEFTATSGAVSFNIMPNYVSRSSAISISFSVSGPDAVLYNVPATILTAPVLPRTLTLSVPTTMVGGVASQLTLLAQYPPNNTVSLTPVAPGFVFNPTTVWINSGQSSVNFAATPIVSGLSNVAVTYTIGGPDAGWYATPAGSSLTVNWGAINIPPTVSGFPVTVPVSISPAPAGEVTVTPVAAGVTFTPSTLLFSPSITSLSFTAVSSIQGQVQVTYILGGEHGQFYNLPVETQETVLTFSQVSLLVTQAPSTNYIAGSMSDAVVLNIGTSATNFVALDSEVVIIPYADVDTWFFPANLSILPGEHTAVFTFITPVVGPVAIGFAILGDAAPLFAVPTSIQVTASPRAFDIAEDLYTNTMSTVPSQVFAAGVTSQIFTIFAKSVPSNVTLTLVSDNFEFHPQVLQFTPDQTTAYFTMVGTVVGPAVISYIVGGEDASLFVKPAAYTKARVTYKISFPIIPSLTVGQTSGDQVVTISPKPRTAFSLTLPQTGGVVYSPAQLIFPAGADSASFTVTAYTTTINTANTLIPGVAQQPSAAQVLMWNLTAREDGEFASYVVPLETYTSINVLPGMFTLHHPRYQMDVTSEVTIEISAKPRSDIVVTLYGNNLYFEPPHVIFTAGGETKQTVKVTPLHATSYELNYAPFKVNYICSGTNNNDYLCPAETHHYVALPRLYIGAIIIAIVGFAIVIVLGLIVTRKIKSRRAKQHEYTPISSEVVIKQPTNHGSSIHTYEEISPSSHSDL